jgi:wobble nucleotide-excising tRNase
MQAQEQTQQPQQIFNLMGLTGDDIQAIMSGMNELPSKFARATMNKVEMQVIQQVQAQENAAKAAVETKKSDAA